MPTPEKKYLAVQVKNEIFVMNNQDELGGLLDLDIPHTILGEVCIQTCCDACHYFTAGNCPCTTMYDFSGDPIRVKQDRCPMN